MSLYGGIELVGQPDLNNVQKLDLLPMGAINEMMRTGFAIDRDHFAQLSTELDAEMVDLRHEICSYIPSEKLDEFIARSNMDSEDDYLPMNVDSAAQLGELLFNVLGVGAGHQLKMTKGGDRISTGKKQLEQLKRTHPVIQKTLSYRERAKLKSTYTEKLPTMAKFHPEGQCWCGVKHFAETYRIHTELLTTRTATRRLASKHPNLQNIPARSVLGRRVRSGFVASPGCELVSVDKSQIEMRLGGHYSLDSNLIRIFQQGLDPHNDTAMRAFNKTEEEVTVGLGRMMYRDPCKNVNFGIFYGLSGSGLLDLMAITYATAGLDLPDWLDQKWCDQFIEQWFGLYPGVQNYLDAQHYRARRYGLVWDLFGGIRRVPEARSVLNRVIEAGMRQGGNMPIQATCAELIKLCIAEIQDTVVQMFRQDGVYCQLLITVHDEIIAELEKGYGELFMQYAIQVMNNVMVDKQNGEQLCRVPLKSEGKVMARWVK